MSFRTMRKESHRLGWIAVGAKFVAIPDGRESGPGSSSMSTGNRRSDHASSDSKTTKMLTQSEKQRLEQRQTPFDPS